MRPTPTPCAAVNSPRKVRREVFCKRYDLCLDYAIEMNWENFSCEVCDGYERESRTCEQWAEEAVRCITLIHFMAFSRLSLKITRNNSNFGRKRREE